MARTWGLLGWSALAVAVPLWANAAEITVCPSCVYMSVSEGIRAAKPRDRVVVRAGIYREREITIEKPLTLLGEPGAVIDAEGAGNILVVRAHAVAVEGLSFKRSGQSYIDDLAAIQLIEADGCRIIENRIDESTFGIRLVNTSNCEIARNRVTGSIRSESQAGNGIHAWKAENIRILDNVIAGHRDGIYFEFVNDSIIERNRTETNLRYGLHFMFSNRDRYNDNLFRKNSSGVAVMYSRQIEMKGNRFESSWGGSAYGVLLKDISASRIENNHFKGNTVGAFLEGTTRSEFLGNRFNANGWGVRVLGNCDGNHFEANRFEDNTFDVSTNSTEQSNIFSGNYWAAYRGLDLNHDGFGDQPYRPVRLSSYLIEQSGVSVLLLKSFFFALIDEAESILPVLTPEAFRDDRPLMPRKRGKT